MDFKEFIEENKPNWERLEKLLQEARGGGLKRFVPAELQGLSRLHRRVNSDFAYAATFYPRTRAAAYLNSLVARSHSVIYRKQPYRCSAILELFKGAPAAFRRNASVFVLSLSILAASMIIGYALTLRDPELAGYFLSPDVLQGVREGRLWTDGILNSIPPSFVSAAVWRNNFVVSIMTFALGLTVAGTASILISNGFMIGSIIAYCQPHGMAGHLLKFMLAHGPLELSAIALAGAAGLILARAILSPGFLTRSASLRRAGRDAASLFAVVVAALTVAALLEGFVSPTGSFSMLIRGILGALAAAVLYAFLLQPKGKSGEGVQAYRTPG